MNDTDKKPLRLDYELLKQAAKGALADAVDPWRLALGPVFGPLAKGFFGPNEALSHDDTKNIGDIIERGRAHGVDEMEIVVSKKRLAGFKGVVTEAANVEVLLGGESDTTATIKVKYR